MNATRLAFAALALGAAFTAGAATPAAAKPSVVIVHGAFADGSDWAKVIPLLQAKGVDVVAVQNPLSSLKDDVDAARRAIDAQPGKVVLVGHSWGGTVITAATLAGCDCCGTWLASSVVTLAPMRWAMSRCCAGGIMWSAFVTTYQDGFAFQAAVDTFWPKASPKIGPWVAVITAVCLGGRSWAKCLVMPSFVRRSQPAASARRCARPAGFG